MITIDEAVPAPGEPDAIAQAIAALTAAARTTRLIGAGTPSEHREPADFGEIACHVLTSVAANAGGVERLLSGRPGSWEADCVRQIVGSTAGYDDAELLRWRTEPVRLVFDLEGTFDDFGLYRLYEGDASALALAENNADEALFEAVATEDERARFAATQAAIPQLGSDEWEADRERAIALIEEATSIRQGIFDRATKSEHPLAVILSAATRASKRPSTSCGSKTRPPTSRRTRRPCVACLPSAVRTSTSNC